MKIPEKGPEWRPILQSTFNDIFSEDMAKFDKINEFINKVDQGDKYLYWDKFKYIDMPEDVSPEKIWAYLKFTRQGKMRKTQFISNDDRNFCYWIPAHVLENLSFIDQHSGGEIVVTDSTVHKSEQKRYLVNSLMEEAIASSQLEGAATTRKVAKEMLRSGRKPRNHAEQMIFNNYQTIMKMKSLLNEPLSDDLILKLHKSMTIETLKNSECGRFRTENDEAIHVADEEGHTLYEPPSPERIPFMMKILYDYANDTIKESYIHPVIKAINLHFYLSYIHPFMDGNGRTARTLFYWYMLKHGYWAFEYLTISRIFLKSPAKYARAFLYAEIDDLDLTYFISFHLRVLELAVVELINYIKRKQQEIGEAAYYLKKFRDLNERQRALLKHAFGHPDAQYTMNEHQAIHDITYEAARRDLIVLEAKKFLVKTKKGRKFYFLPSERLKRKVKTKKKI